MTLKRRKKYGRPSAIPGLWMWMMNLMEQLKTSGLKDIAVLGLSELIPAAKKVLKDRGFDIGPLSQSY